MLTVQRDIAVNLARKAMEHGVVPKGPVSIEWDMSGDCQSPYGRLVRGRSERWVAAGDHALLPAAIREAINLEFPGAIRRRLAQIPASLWVELITRCRKCDNCRKARAMMWRHRAVLECKRACRTWFCTLTLSPEEHFRILTECRYRLGKSGEDFDQLPTGEQFILRCRAIGSHLTKYIKRIRKKNSRIRYLLVAEHHKTGLPHYHGLLHELDPAAPLRYAALQGEWPLGFAQYKLVDDERQAVYVCKYLQKCSAARVRASEHYGEQITLSEHIGHT